jgi:hypothetical protein
VPNFELTKPPTARTIQSAEPSLQNDTTHPHALPKKLQPELDQQAQPKRLRGLGVELESTVSGRSSLESEPFFTRASTALHRRRNATGSRPPPGTDPRCSQTEQQRQGSSTRGGHGASLAEDRRRITSVTTNGEPRAVGSKTVSSRRVRHRSAATARSEDLGFSPGRSRVTEIGLTAPSTRERRPRTPPPWPEGQRFPFGNITAIYTPQHSTRRPPRRPHGRGHRPAPESLARPPTNMTPTFQGRRPGVPAQSTEERERRREKTPPRGSRIPARLRKGFPFQIDNQPPPWLSASLDLGQRRMGSTWAQGPCPDPSSRRRTAALPSPRHDHNSNESKKITHPI